MSDSALVLVADSARARLFSWERGVPQLQEISDLVNAEARLPERALASDRQGRGFNRQRGSRTALGSTALQRNAARRFALRVSAQLATESRTRRAARLFIFSETEFLGLLRTALRSRRLGLPVRTFAKNLTRAAPQRIREYLPKYLGRSA